MTHDMRLPTNQIDSEGQASTSMQLAIGVAWAVLTLVGLNLLLGQWAYDDPYITYRYAKNLVAGHGFVYNFGQHTLSTTAPLYAVLLGGLSLIWPDLPALSNVVSALALVVSAAILGKWSESRGEKAVGMTAALLLSLSPLLLMTFGAEVCMSVMLVLAGFYAYDRSRLSLAAGALALAVMVRPDGLLAAVALGIYHLIRRRSIPWRPVALYAGLVGIWYCGLWLYFGSPVPVTLLAKQQQGQLAASTRFGAGLLELIAGYGEQPLYWLHGVLALLGIGRVLRVSHHWTPLLIWTALYVLSYTLMGVSRYFWYYAPLMPAFVVLVAEGAVSVGRGLRRVGLPRLAVVGASGLLLVALLAPLFTGVFLAGWQLDTRMDVYREIGQWLERNTPPQATVGMLEVGIMGYYAERNVVDFAGLIQPEVARQLTSTSGYEEATTWAIQTYKPDYVVLHHGAGYSPAKKDWFKETYQSVSSFASRENLWMTLYQRSEGK